MWQSLYEELGDAGLVVVTVALDADIEVARPHAEAAAETHPSLVDPSFRLVELFGITNVPFGIWVDEDRNIVRPAEHSPIPRPPGATNPAAAAMAQMPEARRKLLAAMAATTTDPDRYIEAVRDWVAHGSASRYVLSPDEVVARSRPRPVEAAQAAAQFELGQHLYRIGASRDAVAYFQRAHELDPSNWSYQRQARSLADPEWGQVYERDLFDEVARIGPETWRPALAL